MSHKRISNYVILMDKKLGQGAFGTVYRCKQDGSGLEYAVKVLDKKAICANQYLKKAIFQEIRIIQSIKSQNVVGVMDVLQSSNNFYIVQQLCEGDLNGYLKVIKKLSEDKALQFTKQICNGFITIIREGIVHRDLKPANIMLKQGICKIGDFGLAKKNITKRIQNQSSVGTALYSPIQVMKGDSYTSKCDVWAVGCIFYEMLHGKTPWMAHSQYQLVQNITSIPLTFRADISPEAIDFITGCLGIQQQNRLCWDQVYNHKIFKGYFKSYLLQNQQFEDKMKMVMAALRYQINSNNLNLRKLLQGLNLDGLSELSYQQFTLFLHHIKPDLAKQQVSFIVQKMDQNQDGQISIPQLEATLKQYDIQFDKNIQSGLSGILKMAQSLKEVDAPPAQDILSPDPLTEAVQQKARVNFTKLYNILKSKKINLYKVFKAYDKDMSGEFQKPQFQKLMKRLDKTIPTQDIYAIFDYIDKDFSGSVDFEELNAYYCLINGIPETLDVPPEYFQAKKKKLLQG